MTLFGAWIEKPRWFPRVAKRGELRIRGNKENNRELADKLLTEWIDTLVPEARELIYLDDADRFVEMFEKALK